jgi:hypothetical protein
MTAGRLRGWTGIAVLAVEGCAMGREDSVRVERRGLPEYVSRATKVVVERGTMRSPLDLGEA